MDTSSIDTGSVYSIDPYLTTGYPYRSVAYQDSNRLVFSIKNILQNIILGNEDNIGFKIVADEKNDPFKSIWFDNSQIDDRPKLEILYVYNE